jgi:hypothetical protein
MYRRMTHYSLPSRAVVTVAQRAHAKTTSGVSPGGVAAPSRVCFPSALVFGKYVVDLSRPSLQYADSGPCLGCEVLASRQHLRPCRRPQNSHQAKPCHHLIKSWGAPLLRVLGRTPVGRQVIIDGLMSCVNGHRPRNLVGVLAREESCRLA